MNRYVIAYLGWLAGTIGMAGIALGWYRHVEQIGLNEALDAVAARLAATDDTEATEPNPRNRPHKLDDEPAA